IEHERADPAALVGWMHSELFDEERAHLATGEVALVHPVVGPGDFEGALGVSHDFIGALAVAFDFEDELLDALFFVDFQEALLEPRSLVFDGLAIDVAKDELQEFPHAIQIAAMNATHRNEGIRLALHSRWRIHGLPDSGGWIRLV